MRHGGRVRRAGQALLGVSLALVLVAGGEVALASSGNAAESRTGTPVAQVALGSPTPRPVATPARVVVLGDSVPAGAACDCAGFGASLAGSGHLTNAAMDGLTTSGLLAELQAPALLAALHTATLVTVTIGANDFDPGSADDPSCTDAGCYADTLRGTTAALQSVAARITAAVRPGTPVVFTGYWNVFLDGAVGAQQGPAYVATSDALTRRLNAAVASVARSSGLLYADVYRPFKGDGSRDDTGLLAADGDHPDAAGHRVIANAIAETVRLAPRAE